MGAGTLSLLYSLVFEVNWSYFAPLISSTVEVGTSCPVIVTDLSPALGPVSGVLVNTTQVLEPMSISQLNLVQVQLGNQALLDNLAISPIGDLWKDP